MQLKTTAPSDSQTLSEVFSQVLTNDTVNQTVDDTAILDTGIGRGNVVKYSSASGKWVLCNGTVKLNSTDTVGIVEYANGTSGQVRTSGVYLDANLTSILPYYCQANGTLGITVTKVFMGRIASAGRFMMVSGSGGSVQPATTTELGGVIVGNGLNIDGNGLLSSAHGSQMFSSNGTFTVPQGVTTVYISGSGAGGGGGGGTTDNFMAGTGNAGASCRRKMISVTPGQTINITVGLGGAGHAGYTRQYNSHEYANAGGATSFGALLTLSGGGGGSRYNYSADNTGTPAYPAQDIPNKIFGTLSWNLNGVVSEGNLFGANAPIVTSGNAGIAGTLGTGGSGGFGANKEGGNGGNGFIFVEW